MDSVKTGLVIPGGWNVGMSKIYRLKTGKRGGKKWVVDAEIHSTGVYYPDASFEPGEYKVTQWRNGWPSIIEHFEVTEDGKVNDLRTDYGY